MSANIVTSRVVFASRSTREATGPVARARTLPEDPAWTREDGAPERDHHEHRCNCHRMAPDDRRQAGAGMKITPQVRQHIDRLRSEVCDLHAELIRWNLVVWTAGNVSARVPGAELLVVKPSGVN